MPDLPPGSTISDMGTIVVATDGSAAASCALDAAIDLARKSGDHVCVITVWRALQGDFGLAYPPSALLDEILAAERAHAEETLQDATERVEAAGLTVATKLAAGDPPEQICAYADEVDARMIAMGSHGHGALMSLLVGSVSSAVISQARVPVLVVRESDRSETVHQPGRQHAPDAPVPLEVDRTSAGSGGRLAERSDAAVRPRPGA